MMRIFILSFLSACALFWGCSSGSSSPSPFESWMEENGKVKVLSTTAMIDDLVGEIGGDRIDHLTLITGEVDPHSYELVKGDDEKLSYAKVLFCNGLGLEHGASLQYRIQTHSDAVRLGDEIESRSPEKILVVDGQKDPHVWMDISLWMETIDPIVEALSRADPEGASLYKQRAEQLRQKMQQTHDRLKEQLQRVPASQRFLVTSHDAFNYFTRAYLAEPGENETEWSCRFAAPEGLAPEGQLSSADIQGIIEYLALHKVGVVFPESNVSKDSLRKITQACLEKGLKVKISDATLYGDAMGGPGSDGDTYLKMMEHNVSVLLKEWNP